MLPSGQRRQSDSHTPAYAPPIAARQFADNASLGAGQRGEKTSKNGRKPQAGLCPILQDIVHGTKSGGATRYQADHHVRSGGMVNR